MRLATTVGMVMQGKVSPSRAIFLDPGLPKGGDDMADTITNDAVRQNYAYPVGRLLTVGDAQVFTQVEWPDYCEKYELRGEHIPELIRMACDLALQENDSDGPEIWAPVHAWRALAQMRAAEAVEPLLQLTRIDLDDDAVAQEFATVFGMIGPSAIAPIAGFLQERSLPWLAVSLATEGLTEITNRFPEYHNECVGILIRLLEHCADLDSIAVGCAISGLLDLKAVESIDAIREAFRVDAVDISIAGDLEDVEIALGLRKHRSTPRPYYPFASKQLPSAVEAFETGFADFPSEIDNWPRPVKVGRNAPCPCGSGKKYKKCCLV